MSYAIKKEDEDFLLSCGLGLKVYEGDGRLISEDGELEFLSSETQDGKACVSINAGSVFCYQGLDLKRSVNGSMRFAKRLIRKRKRQIVYLENFISKIESIDFEGDKH